MQRHDFELVADYFQFYLQDDNPELGSLEDAWTPQAVDALLAAAPGVVGVRTITNAAVSVTVEFHGAEPERDLARWDQVAECALDVGTGRIVIAGCSEYFPDAARLALPPGLYFVRASFAGLDSLAQDGLGGDRYRVQLWPGRGPRSVRLLKRRASG